MKFELDVTLNPAQIAAAFWDMDSEGQAQFFEALSREIDQSEEASGRIQWVGMAQALERYPEGREAFRCMAGAAFP